MHPAYLIMIIIISSFLIIRILIDYFLIYRKTPFSLLVNYAVTLLVKNKFLSVESLSLYQLNHPIDLGLSRKKLDAILNKLIKKGYLCEFGYLTEKGLNKLVKMSDCPEETREELTLVLAQPKQ